MSSLFISLLTLVLVLVSGFVILLVLMQRTSQNGGMGAALGGGAAESAFGSDTNNILSKATVFSTIAFFLVSLGLFLLYQSKATERPQMVNPEELIRADTPDSSLVEELSTAPEALSELVVDTMDNESSSVKGELESVVESELESVVESELESAVEAVEELPVDLDVSAAESAVEVPAK